MSPSFPIFVLSLHEPLPVSGNKTEHCFVVVPTVKPGIGVISGNCGDDMTLTVVIVKLWYF